jgi:hypothetical protein
MRITCTYSITTHESAEDGECAETGWEDEEGYDCTPDKFDAEEGTSAVDLAVRFLQDKGVSCASSSHWHVGMWYATEPEADLYSGEYTEYNYHLKGFSADDERAIAEQMAKDCHFRV